MYPPVTHYVFENSQEVQRQGSGKDYAAELEKRQAKIDEMVATTSQDTDACVFYLESTDWDLNKAIEMYYNMTSS